MWVHQGEPHQGELSLSVLCTLRLRGLGVSRREPLRKKEKKKLQTLLLQLPRELRWVSGTGNTSPSLQVKEQGHDGHLLKVTQKHGSRAGPGSRPSTRSGQRLCVLPACSHRTPRASLRPCWGRRVFLQPHPLSNPFLGLSGGLYSIYWYWDYTQAVSCNRTRPCGHWTLRLREGK